MTDDTAAYLEELAATLASHGSNLAALRREALEQKVSPYLPTSGPAPTFGAGPPTPQIGSNPVANTLGNTQMFFGQGNRINDPTMGSVFGWDSTTPATVTYQYLAAGSTPGWYLAKVSTVAGGASLLIATVQYVRDQDTNPFNSVSYDLKFTPGTSQTATAYWRIEPVNLQSQPRLPYVVGALRLSNLSNVSDWVNYSSATAYLDLVTGTTGSEAVVATSPAYDLKALFPVLNSTPPDQVQLVVACPFATLGGSSDTGIRLRIELTSSGAVTATKFYVAEPQLHMAYSPDPVPFMPVLGWYEASVLEMWGSGSATDSLIQSWVKGNSTAPRFKVLTSGNLLWAPSTAGVADLRAYRSGTKTLTIDDASGGAATLKVIGTRLAPPSTSQTLAAGTALLANAEFVMFTCTGAVTSTAAPTIADGLDGQMLTVLNVGTGTWTISDQGTLASSNLRLTAATVAIAPRNSIQLVYSSTVADWVQVGALTAVI